MIDSLLEKHGALDWDMVATEKMVTSRDLGIHGIPDAVLKLCTPLKNIFVVIEYKNSERPWDSEHYEE